MALLLVLSPESFFRGFFALTSNLQTEFSHGQYISVLVLKWLVCFSGTFARGTSLHFCFCSFWFPTRRQASHSHGHPSCCVLIDMFALTRKDGQLICNLPTALYSVINSSLDFVRQDISSIVFACFAAVLCGSVIDQHIFLFLSK